MERNVTSFLFNMTTLDRLWAVGSVSDRDPTPLEIQRWEDDGGAALPDAMPSRKRSMRHCAIDEFQFDRELVAAE